MGGGGGEKRGEGSCPSTNGDEVGRQVDGGDEGQTLEGLGILDRAFKQGACSLGFVARREGEALQRFVVVVDELSVSVDGLVVPVAKDFEQLG